MKVEQNECDGMKKKQWQNRIEFRWQNNKGSMIAEHYMTDNMDERTV